VEDISLLARVAPKLFNDMLKDKHVRAVMSRSLAGAMLEEITRIVGRLKTIREQGRV
jgi:hypothetical protein